MGSNNFIENNFIQRVGNAVAAATTDVNSTVVDMKDRGNISFITQIGTATTTGAFTVTIQHSSASTASTMQSTNATVSDSATGVGSNDNGLLVVEAIRPLKRYVRAQVTRGPSVEIDGIIAIFGNVNRAPVTQGSTVLVSQEFLHPAT